MRSHSTDGSAFTWYGVDFIAALVASMVYSSLRYCRPIADRGRDSRSKACSYPRSFAKFVKEK